MVRKMSVLMIAVLLTILLAGCQCQHEWGEADCINPRICGLCEATEGEALGHQYGPWEFAAETMSHSCEVCGEAETLPMDYALLLETKLHGVWELRAFGESMGHLLAEADGTGTLCDALGEKQSFQAEYESHTIGEAQVVYSGVLATEDGSSAFTLYDNHEGADYLTVSIGEQEAEYFRNEALFSIPEGYWAYSDHGKLFYMELNQDRSFSADWGTVDSAASGTQVRNIQRAENIDTRILRCSILWTGRSEWKHLCWNAESVWKT